MKAKEIIERIAKERGEKPEVVEEEMRKAIREAMRTKNPQAQQRWREIAPDGKEPSLDDFLDYCINRLKQLRGW